MIIENGTLTIKNITTATDEYGATVILDEQQTQTLPCQWQVSKLNFAAVVRNFADGEGAVNYTDKSYTVLVDGNQVESIIAAQELTLTTTDGTKLKTSQPQSVTFLFAVGMTQITI